MQKEVAAILKENHRRLDEVVNKPFNPVTGFGSIGERFEYVLTDFPLKKQWLPVAMKSIPLLKSLTKAGSIDAFVRSTFPDEDAQEAREKVIDQFTRLRSRHDFAFWAATFIHIQSKIPGEGEILFRLTRPQRKFVEKLEEKRLQNKPIRIVLLKARQWGGSTTSQLYMMWLQTVHRIGLNSAIVAQTKKTSYGIRAMFDRALSRYPVSMLHKLGEDYADNEPKYQNMGPSGDCKKITSRDCTISIGSYEAPDALRGGNYALVHCSEVGIWAPTPGKSPDDVVGSVCSGIMLKPYTMIIYESTAKGTGNFFQFEYDAAKNGKSQFDNLFISWYDIDLYQTAFENDGEAEFAQWLYDNRLSPNAASDREEPGKYLWWLWEQGATLQAINWYVNERAAKRSHAVMASEYPTDDVEAFVHSGSMVFDQYLVRALKKTCRPQRHLGEVYADKDEGKDALRNLRFREDRQGQLQIWSMPDIDPLEKVTNRYLTVVDVGGRSHKADWSVIVVFDRLNMIDGGKPTVVAQWYGHIDIDLLAWKAAQIAAFYDNSLLVIESNTLETHDKERDVDGDQSQFILNQIKDIYPNLYARKQSEEQIAEGAPVRYGFHTNVATKPMIISTLVKVVRENLYVERDMRCVDEYLTYEKKQNGAFGAIIGKHDDLLMTRAIGLHICFFEMDMPKLIQIKNNPRRGNRPVSAATI